MMARKKRIAILSASIALTVLIIIGILIVLYLKTDAFKTKETLFAKYMLQNFDVLEILKENDNTEIENMLSENKYTTNLEGKIEYTENKGTSSESKNSGVNNVKIQAKGNVDKTNNYKYYDISVVNSNENSNEKLAGLEYLQQDDTYGIRLNDIQQFVTTKGDDSKTQMQSLDELIQKIDVKSILEFTDEEKQTLANTYVGIIQNNISKDKYHKQSNSLITVNEKDVQTNAYYVSVTLEEFNNLYIKMLEQLSKDEIILSKIDKIESKIKENNSDYSGNLKDDFTQKINDKIKNIEDNNIGNDEVKITVYENKMKTVRTSIEKGTQKITLDFYNGSSAKLTTSEVKDVTTEQFIKIEKQNNQTQNNTVVEYKSTQDNAVKLDINLNIEQTVQSDDIDKEIKLEMSNDKTDAIAKISNKINIVQEFDNQVTLEKDVVDMDKLTEQQSNAINNVLKNNVQKQISNILSVASVNDYVKILQNLGLVSKDTIKLPSEGEITDTERKRFNSQFEFFASENLTADNIKELLNTTEGNFEDMKVLLKTGEVQDLDIDKLNSQKDGDEYKKNISEMVFYIKRNSNNEEKTKLAEQYLEKNKNDKYTVSIQYDSDGLVSLIRAKIQENK
mgnify:FL=1|jgi:hypothetical protein